MTDQTATIGDLRATIVRLADAVRKHADLETLDDIIDELRKLVGLPQDSEAVSDD
jgi:hypothetical protein